MKNRGYLLVLGTAFISGFSIFINKFGVAVSNPYVFAFLKNIIVAVILCGIILALKDWQFLKALKKKQWGLLLAIGLIGGSIPFLLFFKGLAMTSAAEASFIQKTIFFWVMAGAVIFLKEKITKNHIIAGTLLIAGNLLLLKLSDIKFDQGGFLVLLATLFWAAENIISKYALREMPARLVMWARMFFGSIFIFIFLAVTGQAILLAQLDLNRLGWSLFTGIILFGYVVTWYSGLKQIKVVEATIILALGSPITTYLNAISSGSISLKQNLAAILIILGIAALFGLEKILKNVKQLYVRS